MLKIFSFVLLINMFGINAISKEIEKQNIEYFQNIINKIEIPNNLKFKILSKDDANWYYKKKDKNSYSIYQATLNEYNVSIFSYIIGDFNSNGKEDVAIACKDEKSNHYLIIIEENNNQYQFIQMFKLKFMFYLHESSLITKKKFIQPYYQIGTSWSDTIFWENNKYIIASKDPYGP